MRLTPTQLRNLAVPTVMLIAVVIAAIAGSNARAGTSTTMLGFQSDGDPTSLITKDKGELGSVGVDGLNLTGGPGAVSSPSSQDLAQLKAAEAAGLPALLLVGNFSDQINDFSEPLAYRTLSSATATATLAQTLAAYVKSEGWSGLSIDLESLTARDRSGLTRLLADLRADLGANADLNVDVMNETSQSDYLATGYDLATITRSVTNVTLMAYDQHGPWEPTPGPVAANSWVTQGLDALAVKVPARQILLGVAAYGYVWEPGSKRQLSDAQAITLVKRARVAPHWNPAVGEWSAKLRNGGTVWWSDARTLALRRRLAVTRGLGGLALWSLGLAG